MADALENVLSEKEEDNKTELDVLKELFGNEDIETKSELSINQIILFNQKRMISKMLYWRRLEECLNDFMQLMVSKDRKGRGEFIDGFKSNRDRDVDKQGGFFSGLKNRLGFS